MAYAPVYPVVGYGDPYHDDFYDDGLHVGVGVYPHHPYPRRRYYGGRYGGQVAMWITLGIYCAIILVFLTIFLVVWFTVIQPASEEHDRRSKEFDDKWKTQGGGLS